MHPIPLPAKICRTDCPFLFGLLFDLFAGSLLFQVYHFKFVLSTGFVQTNKTNRHKRQALITASPLPQVPSASLAFVAFSGGAANFVIFCAPGYGASCLPACVSNATVCALEFGLQAKWISAFRQRNERVLRYSFPGAAKGDAFVE